MFTADLASSFRAFGRAAAEFFANLSQIEWTTFAVALVFLAAM
jgi:hypothetical protein